MRKIVKINLLLAGIFLIAFPLNASFNANFESHQTPSRHSSHSEVMPDEDRRDFEAVYSNADLTDIDFELKQIDDEAKALRVAQTKTMKTRNCRTIFWASCHDRFSGIIKGSGYLLAGTGLVLTGVNELFISGNQTPLSISGIVLGMVGGCVLAWSELSKNTAANLDQQIHASLDLLHQQKGLLNKKRSELLAERSPDLKLDKKTKSKSSKKLKKIQKRLSKLEELEASLRAGTQSNEAKLDSSTDDKEKEEVPLQRQVDVVIEVDKLTDSNQMQEVKA